MLDESIIFSILCEEISYETGLPYEGIHYDSMLTEDLGLYDEERERVLIEVSDRLACSENIVDTRLLYDCTTARDLLEAFMDSLCRDPDEDGL